MKLRSQIIGLAGALAILASVFSPLSLAQETKVSREGGGWGQEITGTLSGAKILRVKVDMGSVVVRGRQQEGISYIAHTRYKSSSEQDARHQFELYKISAYVRGDTAWIVGDWQGGHKHKFSGEFTIDVPREMSWIKLETEGGNVDAMGISGKVEAESGGGSMHLDDIGGGINVDTGGGSIEIGTIGGEIGLHTGGGSIEVRRASGKVIAETGGGSVEIQDAGQMASIDTGGGSIEVRQCSGKVKVTTGGGSIDLGDIGGPAEIETGGGSIHLTSAKGHVQAETSGGDIELLGVPSARAQTGAGGITVKLINTGSDHNDSSLETSAGDITVYIASDVAVNVRASVELGNGHRISSDFGEVHISSEGDKWGPKTLNAEGKLNGGGPLLKIRTTTGDICIKRLGR